MSTGEEYDLCSTCSTREVWILLCRRLHLTKQKAVQPVCLITVYTQEASCDRGGFLLFLVSVYGSSRSRAYMSNQRFVLVLHIGQIKAEQNKYTRVSVPLKKTFL